MGWADENVLVCAFVYCGNIVDSVDASEFNDKPAGGGDRAAQHLTPKLRLHRCHLVGLLGIFLPRMSNEVAFSGLSLN